MSKPDYVAVAEARQSPGLRLALTKGMPGPWSVSAKCILEIKKLPYIAVPQVAGDPNDELFAWTGHRNAPVAVYDDEPGRAVWTEILFLAERLAPEPALIPADPDQRALMFGLAHEICGEQGFGWCSRVLLLAMQEEANTVIYSSLKERYWFGDDPVQVAARLRDILGMLERQMERQAEAGSDYLVGDSLTALDIYWMAFSVLIDAMSPDMCVMPDFYTAMGPSLVARIDRAPAPILLEHRDRIARRHVALPIEC